VLHQNQLSDTDADVHREILRTFMPQEIYPGVIVIQERRESKSFDVEMIIAREKRAIEREENSSTFCR